MDPTKPPQANAIIFHRPSAEKLVAEFDTYIRKSRVEIVKLKILNDKLAAENKTLREELQKYTDTLIAYANHNQSNSNHTTTGESTLTANGKGYEGW